MTFGIPLTHSMSLRDVNAELQLVETCWRHDIKNVKVPLTHSMSLRDVNAELQLVETCWRHDIKNVKVHIRKLGICHELISNYLI